MKYSIFLCLSILIVDIANGQDVIPLYPDKIPNSKSAPDKEETTVRENGTVIVSAISVPTLSVYLPAQPDPGKAAVIIFPGGGYVINAIKHEGFDIAEKLNEWGVAAFVVKYRIPNDETMHDKSIGPLQDAQQAIAMVRKNAAKWNVNPDNIGIMGFSAGGHLASTLATHFTRPLIADRTTKLRPDFAILGYPVVSFSGSIGHSGSRRNLLGESPSEEKVAEFSNEQHVTSETPPTFLVHASDDKSVSPKNSIIFYEALLKHNVPAELHFYERGGHGFGMDNPTTKEKWMPTLKNWFLSRSILKQ